MVGLYIEFYFGQNEDYSLGESISDHSKKLPHRGRGKSIYIYACCEGGVNIIKLIFFAESYY